MGVSKDFVRANVFGFGGMSNPINPAMGSQEGTQLLGGKGYALSWMSNNGFPVPPGFTVSTKVSESYRDDPYGTMEVVAQVIFEEKLPMLATHFGYDPLLSVRSGAPVSMPGMMDTILNVGMGGAVFEPWADRIGERAAFDSWRRLLSMIGTTALGMGASEFEAILEEAKQLISAKTDSQLPPVVLASVVEQYRALYTQKKVPIPETAQEQLWVSIGAVFESWNSERAVAYRKQHGIPEDIGTAVNVQAMVFGNMNEASGTGVLFTRNPQTGEPAFVGEFLPNAQGEDVVAGIRTPLELSQMPLITDPPGWPDIHKKLYVMAQRLEDMLFDVQDIEFTVQDSTLYLLQTRSAKRTAAAAFRVAMDMYKAGSLSWDDAKRRVTKDQYRSLRQVTVDPVFKDSPDMKGIPACPGVVAGKVCYTDAQIDSALANNENPVLFRSDTTPDDFPMMVKSAALVTMKGGHTSHAAVVARSLDTPCIVGCGSGTFTGKTSPAMSVGGKKIKAGSLVTICGLTGRIWFNVGVPLLQPEFPPAAHEFLLTGMEKQATTAGPTAFLDTSEYGMGRAYSLIDALDAPQEEFNAFIDMVEGSGGNGVVLLETFADRDATLFPDMFEERDPIGTIRLARVERALRSIAKNENEIQFYASANFQSKYGKLEEYKTIAERVMPDRPHVTTTDNFVLSLLC